MHSGRGLFFQHALLCFSDPDLSITTPKAQPSNQCYIIYIMGCIKSKHSSQAVNASSTEKVGSGPTKNAGEKTVLVTSEVGPGQDRPPVDPVLLDYAERLSEDIVARAVQQWAELDSRYSDIPYIECDVP